MCYKRKNQFIKVEIRLKKCTEIRVAGLINPWCTCAARVMVVVQCVCVCVCVFLFVVFCHHAHVDPKIYVPTDSLQCRKKIIIVVFA